MVPKADQQLTQLHHEKPDSVSQNKGSTLPWNRVKSQYYVTLMITNSEYTHLICLMNIIVTKNAS